MICPICGYESSGNFCSNCGEPLENDKNGYLPEEFDTFNEIREDWQERRSSEPGQSKPGKEKKNNSHNAREREAKTDKKDQKKQQNLQQKQQQKQQKEQQKQQQKQQKERQKEQHKRDERMKSLESEVERLRNWAGMEAATSQVVDPEHVKPKRSYAREAEWENDNLDHEDFEGRFQRGDRQDFEGSGFGEAVAKGAVGIVVLLSRLMQFASTVLMACLVLTMAQSFWRHGQGLGDIRLAVEERNYGLAFYVGFAGITLLMGLIWCLWILSRKGAGGGVRMKKYDTGRGFWPFLICITAIILSSIIAKQIPIEPETWKGIGIGVTAALEAVNGQWEILLFCSAAGAVLSLVRKMMRV